MINENDNLANDIQIKPIVRKIRKKFNPIKIILFGSWAHGTPGKGSDIDLLIVMNTDVPVKHQAFMIRREISSSIPVDIIVRTPMQIDERIRMGDTFIKKAYEKGVEL